MTLEKETGTGVRRLADVPLLGFLLRWVADIIRLPNIHRHIALHVQMVEQRTLNLELTLESLSHRFDALEAKLTSDDSVNSERLSNLSIVVENISTRLKARAAEIAEIRVIQDSEMSEVKRTQEELATVKKQIHHLKNEVSATRELLPLSVSWDSAAEFVSEVRLGLKQHLNLVELPDGKELVGNLFTYGESLKSLPVQSEKRIDVLQQPELSRDGQPSLFHCYVGQDRVLTKTKRGLFLVCDSRDLQMAPALISEGVWEKATTELYEKLIPAGGTYLEIGANVGYFTTLAASHVGHYGSIFAYEPNPRAFQLLQENLRINRQSYITNLRSSAVADSEGKRVLNSFVNNMPSSTLATLDPILIREMNESSTAVEVECTTLDSDFGNTEWKFDVVKIDAEGSEPLILAGASQFFNGNLKSDSVLILEWNPIAMRGLKTESDSLLQSLISRDFHVFKVESAASLRSVRSCQDLGNWGVAELIATKATDALRSKGFDIS